MADSSKIIGRKKFMWDGLVYASREEAQSAVDKYKANKFEVELVIDESHFLVYTRRVVKEIVLDGPAPA